MLTKCDPTKIQNLVFQGGSVRGLAYGGAIKALESHLNIRQIKRVAGTSAGAITALILSLGYGSSDIEKITNEIDFKECLDGRLEIVRSALLKTNDKVSNEYPTSIAKVPAKVVSPFILYQLYHYYGIFEGDFLLNWLEDLLFKATNIKLITFKELHELHIQAPEKFKDLYVFGANISTHMSLMFSWETTPNVIVSNAVRISMSIPWIFKPCGLIEKNAEGQPVSKDKDVWVDGGILDNYPIHSFDKTQYLSDYNPEFEKKPIFNEETLGFRLVDREKKQFFEGESTAPQNDIDNWVGFTFSVLKTIRNKQNSDHNLSDDKKRTIYIDTVGVETLDFNLSESEKKSLLISGESAVEQFFTGKEPANSQAALTFLSRNEDVHVETAASNQKEIFPRPSFCSIS